MKKTAKFLLIVVTLLSVMLAVGVASAQLTDDELLKTYIDETYGPWEVSVNFINGCNGLIIADFRHDMLYGDDSEEPLVVGRVLPFTDLPASCATIVPSV